MNHVVTIIKDWGLAERKVLVLHGNGFVSPSAPLPTYGETCKAKNRILFSHKYTLLSL